MVKPKVKNKVQNPLTKQNKNSKREANVHLNYWLHPFMVKPFAMGGELDGYPPAKSFYNEVQRVLAANASRRDARRKFDKKYSDQQRRLAKHYGHGHKDSIFYEPNVYNVGDQFKKEKITALQMDDPLNILGRTAANFWNSAMRDPIYSTAELMIQTPQSALVELSKGLNGDYRRALPEIARRYTPGGDTVKMSIPSEEFGYSNPQNFGQHTANFALNMLDPALIYGLSSAVGRQAIKHASKAINRLPYKIARIPSHVADKGNIIASIVAEIDNEIARITSNKANAVINFLNRPIVSKKSKNIYTLKSLLDDGIIGKQAATRKNDNIPKVSRKFIDNLKPSENISNEELNIIRDVVSKFPDKHIRIPLEDLKSAVNSYLPRLKTVRGHTNYDGYGLNRIGYITPEAYFYDKYIINRYKSEIKTFKHKIKVLEDKLKHNEYDNIYQREKLHEKIDEYKSSIKDHRLDINIIKFRIANTKSANAKTTLLTHPDNIGSVKHQYPKHLGHFRYINEDKDVLRVVESQSNWKNELFSIDPKEADVSNSLYFNKGLHKNIDIRKLQEEFMFAAKQGKKYIDYPTSETTYKIQNYATSSKPIESYKSVLNEYIHRPRLVKKLFGKDPIEITDELGNSWFRFEIPDDIRKNKAVIRAFSSTAIPTVGGTILGSAVANNKQKAMGGKLDNKNKGVKRLKRTAKAVGNYYGNIARGALNALDMVNPANYLAYASHIMAGGDPKAMSLLPEDVQRLYKDQATPYARPSMLTNNPYYGAGLELAGGMIDPIALVGLAKRGQGIKNASSNFKPRKYKNVPYSDMSRSHIEKIRKTDPKYAEYIDNIRLNQSKSKPSSHTKPTQYKSAREKEIDEARRELFDFINTNSDLQDYPHDARAYILKDIYSNGLHDDIDPDELMFYFSDVVPRYGENFNSFYHGLGTNKTSSLAMNRLMDEFAISDRAPYYIRNFSPKDNRKLSDAMMRIYYDEPVGVTEKVFNNTLLNKNAMGGKLTGGFPQYPFGGGLALQILGTAGGLISNAIGAKRERQLMEQQEAELEATRLEQERKAKLYKDQTMLSYIPQQGYQDAMMYAGGGQMPGQLRLPRNQSMPIDENAQMALNSQGGIGGTHEQGANIPVKTREGQPVAEVEPGEVVVTTPDGNQFALSKRLGFAQQYVKLQQQLDSLQKAKSKTSDRVMINSLERQIKGLEQKINQLPQQQEMVKQQMQQQMQIQQQQMMPQGMPQGMPQQMMQGAMPNGVPQASYGTDIPPPDYVRGNALPFSHTFGPIMNSNISSDWGSPYSNPESGNDARWAYRYPINVEPKDFDKVDLFNYDMQEKRHNYFSGSPSDIAPRQGDVSNKVGDAQHVTINPYRMAQIVDYRNAALTDPNSINHPTVGYSHYGNRMSPYHTRLSAPSRPNAKVGATPQLTPLSGSPASNKTGGFNYGIPKQSSNVNLGNIPTYSKSGIGTSTRGQLSNPNVLKSTGATGTSGSNKPTKSGMGYGTISAIRGATELASAIGSYFIGRKNINNIAKLNRPEYKQPEFTPMDRYAGRPEMHSTIAGNQRGFNTYRDFVNRNTASSRVASNRMLAANANLQQSNAQARGKETGTRIGVDNASAQMLNQFNQQGAENRYISDRNNFDISRGIINARQANSQALFSNIGNMITNVSKGFYDIETLRSIARMYGVKDFSGIKNLDTLYQALLGSAKESIGNA